MGDCKYCGKSAGFLRQKHSECEENHAAALGAISAAATAAATGRDDLDALADVRARARSRYVSEDDARQAIIRGWEGAVDHFLEDGALDESEEQLLLGFMRNFGFTQADVDKGGSYSRIVKGGVLRDVLSGTIPSRLSLTGSLPFNFQKAEQLVWVFTAVEYLEDKTRREYVGRGAGVSLRVMKGVYYRTGVFRGHPVERTERVIVDRGILAVTNKHLYFGGPAKSFRVRHEKIVTYIPFSDGVGIVRDASTAKPQIFVTGDGWFTYNLLVNVGQL